MDMKLYSKSPWPHKICHIIVFFGQGGVLQNKHFPISPHWEMFADTYTQTQQVPLNESGKEQTPFHNEVLELVEN